MKFSVSPTKSIQIESLDGSQISDGVLAVYNFVVSKSVGQNALRCRVTMSGLDCLCYRTG